MNGLRAWPSVTLSLSSLRTVVVSLGVVRVKGLQAWPSATLLLPPVRGVLQVGRWTEGPSVAMPFRDCPTPRGPCSQGGEDWTVSTPAASSSPSWAV